jgi:DNA-binding response OmpR family regulator
MAKILLIEDDKSVAQSLSQWLTSNNHTVELALTGIAAEELLQAFKYDVVIVDWGLPDKSGIDICREFRAAGGKTPILMMTARSQTEDKEMGLDSGADDYLTKPVDVRELSARIRALMRRPGDVAQSTIQVGCLLLDPARNAIFKRGEEIQLTHREFAVLEFLMRHPEQYFTAETLLERVWSAEIDTTALTVRVCIKRLRDKIDSQEQSLIENSKGLGYRLRAYD